MGRLWFENCVFWPMYQRRVPVLCEDGGGGDGEEDPQDREADRDDGEHGGPPHVLFKQEQDFVQ